MRAAVLEQYGGPLHIREVEDPKIGPHEALVRVHYCGVCGTDLKIRTGKMGHATLPMVMGHEAAGEVVEVGDEVEGFQAGDRVTVNFYVTCGQCQFCREGRETLCLYVRQHGFNMDGGYAEYMKTPAVNLCKVPKHVPLDQACILADAVSTSYHAVTKRAQVRPGKTVAVVGTGGVGLHAVQMAKLAGGWVIAVDVNEERLAVAQKLGADAIVSATRDPFYQQVRQLTSGEGVDVVIELVANKETLESSYRSLKKAGRLVFVGYTPDIPMSFLPHEVVRNELEIMGSRANTKQELQETMDLVAQGRIRPIIDRALPLEEVELAHELLRQGRFVGRGVLAIS